MISLMLKPFFKRFIGLFISMAFVATLAVALLSAFASTIYNLETTFANYLLENGNVNVIASIGFADKEKFADITEVEGVANVEYRLTMNAFLKKSDGRTITSGIFTTKDDDSAIIKLYVVEGVESFSDRINVSVVRKFAENNGFEVGNKITIGYSDCFVDCYINQIVEVPEAIQARTNNYVWSDNSDFGYIYIDESQMAMLVDRLAEMLKEKTDEDPAFLDYLIQSVTKAGINIFDILNTDAKSFTERATNQILITAKDGYSEEQVAANVQTYLESKSATINSITENHKLFYYVYIENVIKQLRVMVIFLPVFFYLITMIVIGLFINQIIKVMTPQIGIMTSIGVGHWDIISVFIAFTLLMSTVSGILGTGFGVLLTRALAIVMRRVYSIPTIPFSVQPLIAVTSVLALTIFAMLTAIISCRQIFKITPKDATISNEAKRKSLPLKLEAFVDRAPLAIKLSINSIAQNTRRFLVSVFSIFSSLVIIILSCFFYISKNELMSQTVDRRLSFDVQVYMTSIVDDETVEDIRSQTFVKELINCDYAYVEVADASGKSKSYLECLAFDEASDTELIIIPSEKGNGNLKIQQKGIILPKSTAEELGVKKGDNVLINGNSVKVNDVSFQYFHPITYLSKTQFEALGVSYVSSILANVTDETEFLDYMSDKNASISVFTSNLSRDIHTTFNSIDVFVYVMIAFSLAISFIILTIMGQNALIEQKRQLSELRLIGFAVNDISNLWLLQSVAQIIIAAVLAIPIGALTSSILFTLASSASQTYPFVFSWTVNGFALGFIALIVLASHVISMLTIKRWNLADNTRARE